MRLKNLIKRWDFEEAARADLDLSGGLRLNPGPPITVHAALELPRQATPNDHLYSTSATLYAQTWIARPRAAKEWRGFQAEITHARDPDGGGAVVTTAGYRVTDGSDEYWWDGAAWVVDNVNWNTEAEVASNIANFPISERALGFVINLATADARVSPRLRAVKVLYGASLDHEDDYIHRSLIPSLKTNIRPLGRLLYEHAGGTTFTLDEDARPSAPYDIVDVDAVFNEDDDPDHLDDLLSSYNAGTGLVTLSSNPGAVELFVHFVYRPAVAWNTDQDFSEVNTIPALHIDALRIVDASERQISDSVLNVGTNQGVRVFAPRQGDIEFTLSIVTDKATDQFALAGQVREYFAQNPFLTSVGMDEKFRLWLIDEPESTGGPVSNGLVISKARARIVGAVFFERGSESVTGVTGFNINGLPNFSLP